MLQVADKARRHARRLAKETRKTIENELDSLIYEQMRKLEHKSAFLRQYWAGFDREKKELKLGREELMAERISLSVLNKL
jgi:hypothetical protein